MQGENVKNGMMQILHHYIEKKEKMRKSERKKRKTEKKTAKMKEIMQNDRK